METENANILLGELIRQRRIDRGMSQEEFAGTVYSHSNTALLPQDDFAVYDKLLRQMVTVGDHALQLTELFHCVTPDYVPFITCCVFKVDAGQQSLLLQEVLKYVETHNQGIRRSAGYLPLVAHNYARELTIAGRYREAVKVGDKGWKISVSRRYYEFLGGLAHTMAEGHHYLGGDAPSVPSVEAHQNSDNEGAEGPGISPLLSGDGEEVPPDTETAS